MEVKNYEFQKYIDEQRDLDTDETRHLIIHRSERRNCKVASGTRTQD